MKIFSRCMIVFLSVLFTQDNDVNTTTDGLVKECNATVSMKDLSGEIIIAGLFPLNYYSSKNSAFVLNDVAITWVEAFTFAVRQINNDSNILPGIRIGYDVRNSCNEEYIALKNVLDFMLDLSFLDKKGKRKGVVDSRRCGCVEARNRIVAVVGGASSSISTSVSNVLSVDGVPQISYSSTSVALSNKEKYPNFLRTLPSDIYQAKAMVALLKKFDWTFISVLASDDDYGRLGFYQLEKEMQNENMCIAESKIFKRSLSTERLNEIIYLLQKGLGKRASVVVLWCQINEAKIIIEEAWKAGLNNLTWLGCETLGNNIHLLPLGDMVKGFIGLKPTLSRVLAFEDYLDKLQPSNYSENPWLQAYWSFVPTWIANKSESFSNSITAPQIGRVLPKSKYSHVISAVYAVSLALHEMTANQTGSIQQKLATISPKALYNTIKNVKYRDPYSDLKIGFDKEGDPEFASYIFTNIRRFPENGSIDFVDIGEWEGETGNTLIHFDKIEWTGNKATVHSKCSTPCRPGMYKILGDVSCCWTCVSCKVNFYSTNGNVTSCSPCSETAISNDNKTKCLQLKEVHFSANSTMLDAVLFIASLEILSVIFVFVVYIKYWNTPVVKSSNRELSLIQLTFLFAAFWYPTSYLMKPSKFNCTLQPVWLALCPTIVLAITFVKTYRLYRIFNKVTTEQSRLLHNKYQSISVLFILFIQVLLITLWLQSNNMAVVKTVNREDMSFIRHCCENAGTLLVISQSYNLGISLACAFMAFRARKLPNAFNEARYITFGTFTYCLSWILSIPLFLSADVMEKSQVICVMNIVTNLALFLCLYGNKMRVVIFLPEQNTKHFFTRQATVDQFVRTQTNPSAMTSSWPTLPRTGATTWSVNSSILALDQRNGSVGSLNSLVSSKKIAGTCNPRIMKRYAPTPRDLVFAKCGRERSQTVD